MDNNTGFDLYYKNVSKYIVEKHNAVDAYLQYLRNDVSKNPELILTDLLSYIRTRHILDDSNIGCIELNNVFIPMLKTLPVFDKEYIHLSANGAHEISVQFDNREFLFFDMDSHTFYCSFCYPKEMGEVIPEYCERRYKYAMAIKEYLKHKSFKNLKEIVRYNYNDKNSIVNPFKYVSMLFFILRYCKGSNINDTIEQWTDDYKSKQDAIKQGHELYVNNTAVYNKYHEESEQICKYLESIGYQNIN